MENEKIIVDTYLEGKIDDFVLKIKETFENKVNYKISKKKTEIGKDILKEYK